jgi:hypothetical protein
VLTARIEEAFWRRLRGTSRDDGALVFEDQYISTGGQLAELLLGHDRMIADLRPLVHARLRRPTALACHPYDICTELILREAGGVVESPDGRRLDVPLDTETPVAWVAFANPRLARLARPALRRRCAASCSRASQMVGGSIPLILTAERLGSGGRVGRFWVRETPTADPGRAYGIRSVFCGPPETSASTGTF